MKSALFRVVQMLPVGTLGFFRTHRDAPVWNPEYNPTGTAVRLAREASWMPTLPPAFRDQGPEIDLRRTAELHGARELQNLQQSAAAALTCGRKHFLAATRGATLGEHLA